MESGSSSVSVRGALTPLLELPVELLLMIVAQLDSQGDTNALSQTNKRLYHLLGPILYQNNVKYYNGDGIFHASHAGAVRAVQQFIATGFNVRYPCDYESFKKTCRTPEQRDDYRLAHPILNASNSGHVEVVKYLLDEGSDPRFKDERGDTPLAHAARRGCLPIVKLILSTDVYTATDRCQPDDIQRAMQNAARGAQTEVVEFLLSYLQHDDRYKEHYSSIINESLPSAAASGHIPTASLLLQHGASVNYPNPPPEAYESLRNRPPPRVEAALGTAAVCDYPDMVQFLLEQGADANRDIEFNDTSSAFGLATNLRHEAVVKELLDWPGIEIPGELWGVAFRDTIMNGRTGMGKLLWTKYKDIWGKRPDRGLMYGFGLTLLQMARRYGRDELVDVFKDDDFYAEGVAKGQLWPGEILPLAEPYPEFESESDGLEE
ncbi:ankyrin repeat domain-containing protein [Aspergillus lucknowensis]|uniref:Ankyrin repeat-containing domain protein n=1 Tax=Aspergillus lucknowensis TaxID=176173 RepID=A0ABR4LIJ5_9EURO